MKMTHLLAGLSLSVLLSRARQSRAETTLLKEDKRC